MRHIYFFDVNEILIDRYPAEVAKSINLLCANEEDVKFIFLYHEQYEPNNVPKNIPKNSKVYFKNHFNFKTLDYITKKYPPDTFVSVGLRIPDIFLFAYFNTQFNIETYMIQHGLFTSKLERVNPILFLLKRYSSIIRIFQYIYSISKILNTPFFKILLDFYYVHFQNKKKPVESKYYFKFLISKKAFIFDKSWNEYYSKSYGYAEEQFVYIGNPDYNLAQGLLKRKFEKNTVCYISQSMVEDGRYVKEKFLKFLSELKSNLSDYKIHIKLHPRSDIKLYKKFIDKSFSVSNDLINCSTYIGHYSSLIKIPFLLGRKVIIWELSDHFTPPEFDQYSNKKTSNWGELRLNIVDSNEDQFIISNEMSKFLVLKTKPTGIISNHILNKN